LLFDRIVGGNTTLAAGSWKQHWAAQIGFIGGTTLDVAMFRDGAERSPGRPSTSCSLAKRPAPGIRCRRRKFKLSTILNLRDLIGAGLIDPSWLAKYPPELADRLKQILDSPDS
jgi:hypothetical protein